MLSWVAPGLSSSLAMTPETSQLLPQLCSVSSSEVPAGPSLSKYPLLTPLLTSNLSIASQTTPDTKSALSHNEVGHFFLSWLERRNKLMNQLKN